MSTKTIFIFSLLLIHSTIIEAEIDCLGKSFFCTTDNTFLMCYYDEVRNTTVTMTDRSELCPGGTFCDMSSEIACDQGIDCEGKSFFCPTVSSYMRCTVQPDGTFRTTSNDVIMCPDETYCDHNYGDFECDSPVIPSTDWILINVNDCTEL